jgi:endonuclease/exonuclease/phosphatase family metal-dependent hydrolase
MAMALRVRIATFNLESLDDRPDMEPRLSERIRVLRPQLLRLQADVLCLQEVNAQQSEKHGPRKLLALEKLLRETPYAGYHLAASGMRGGEDLADVHNLVTLSRFPIAQQRQSWHDLVPAPKWRPVTAQPPAETRAAVEWDRPILYTALGLDEGSDGGRLLHLVNLHLRSPLAAVIEGQKLDAFTWKSVPGWAEGFWLAAIKRGGQALEARLLIDRLFDADGEALVAVCGDFNATARETAVRMIRGDEEDTGSGRLAGRAMVPVERSIPDSQRYSVLHHGEPVMLDHVLVSRALMAWFRHAEIHNEALEDELVAFATVSRSPVSFHAPVLAEFDLPEPA